MKENIIIALMVRIELSNVYNKNKIFVRIKLKSNVNKENRDIYM